MQDPTHTWKPQGAVFLWRYLENTRNYPGWHLTADSTGVRSILALLDLLASSSVRLYRTIPVTRPTIRELSAPNNKQGTAKTAVPAKWRFDFDPTTPGRWTFPQNLEPACLSFGPEYVPALVAGLTGIENGSGDYSIGPKTKECPDLSAHLWFWWRP